MRYPRKQKPIRYGKGDWEAFKRQQEERKEWDEDIPDVYNITINPEINIKSHYRGSFNRSNSKRQKTPFIPLGTPILFVRREMDEKGRHRVSADWEQARELLEDFFHEKKFVDRDGYLVSFAKISADRETSLNNIAKKYGVAIKYV